MSTRPPLEGSAFPLAVKLLASTLVGAMLAWGASAAPALASTPWTGSAIALMVAAVAMVLWCLTWIWRSRIRVDSVGLRQSWLWDKRVDWTEVAQARLVGVPGFDWLVAPRVVLRVKGRGVVVFHIADRAVLQAVALFVATGTAPALA